ncbi:MAG TPA: hypothetical protein VN085_06560 [Vicinamibacterales bacterium]|nr:hypothetical protein [Vicinamibacterales bacterium]
MTQLLAVVVPVPTFGGYFDGMLGPLQAVLADVLPYAAGVAAFAIAVALVKRWLGNQKATALVYLAENERAHLRSYNYSKRDGEGSYEQAYIDARMARHHRRRAGVGG